MTKEKWHQPVVCMEVFETAELQFQELLLSRVTPPVWWKVLPRGL